MDVLRRWLVVPDRRVLVASLALQLALAALLGHSFDTRVSMATGYLVGTGHDPYLARDLTTVFHHASFDVLRSIGYPPPWPLLAGLLYRASYALVPSLVLYNIVLKLPVVAATTVLGCFVAALVRQSGLGEAATRRAFAWLLLNPFVLMTAAAWGQIDVIVALLATIALVALATRRPTASALLLALAVCVKPIALPLLPAALVYLWHRSARAALRYAALAFAGMLAFYVLPFYLFGWSTLPLQEHLNRHFVSAGALSFTTVVRAWHGPVLLSGHWWLLGMLWLPALVAAIVVFRRGGRDLMGLFALGLAFVLVVYLTRAWLAEPNVVLVLAPALMLALAGALDRRLLTALWLVPLAFLVADATPLQLLWLLSPQAMQDGLRALVPYSDALLVAQAALVVLWQVTGWWAVVRCYRWAQAREVGAEARRQAGEAAGPEVAGLGVVDGTDPGRAGVPDTGAVGTPV